jgi:ribonuclease P protein component
MDRLKKRRDFLAVAKGKRQHTATLTLQMAPSGLAGARVGFTVTKKVGHATERNRIRRRLKEAARLEQPSIGRDGHDYVIVARRAALSAPFESLRTDVRRTFANVHMSKKPH